ncbi:MAG: hypothetical protein NTY96_07550 [Bacteroidetes bacterium]|nr:hypothetical protein [Bacteroidota bacterium]
MRSSFIFFLCWLMAIQLYSQNTTKPASSGQIKFVSTGQVLQDLQQNGAASKYYETAKDLIFLDENLIGALNAITPGIVTLENMDYIKYINSRDQKPYREVWDHNVYMKYTASITDIQQLLTDQPAFADLKKRLGREFNHLDIEVFINGTDRIMFILRSPNSEAGSFYRAILTNGSIRIDEVSNWRDS